MDRQTLVLFEHQLIQEALSWETKGETSKYHTIEW